MVMLPLVISIIFFILGLLGTVLPVLPGAILIYAGMLVYGIMTGFKSMTVNFSYTGLDPDNNLLVDF